MESVNTIIEKGIAVAKQSMGFRKGLAQWKKGKEYPYKIDKNILMVQTEQGDWNYWNWNFKIALAENSFNFFPN